MSLRALVVCPPGLEDLVSAEMRSLGVTPGRPVFGGVPCDISHQQLYAMNLRLRTATRVLLRLGNGFVDGPRTLDRLVAQMDWDRFIGTQGFAVSATCHSSTLFHSDMVAEHAEAVIAERCGLPARDPQAPPAEAVEGEQRVLVRIDHDRATISLDSSGERLDRRGYRLQGAKAPLRETLAAAAVLASGWRADRPLIDPFCGSGTIAIEAALFAARLAPGRNRRFAFQQWPSFTRKAWRGAREEAEAAARPMPRIVIAGSDRDQGAVAAAKANAERAGVAAAIEFRCCAVTEVVPPVGTGAIVTNPPYGVRVGEADRLRDLYDATGRWGRTRAPGWSLTVLDADRRLTSRLGVDLADRIATSNGGIDVRIAHGVFAGTPGTSALPEAPR